MCLCNAKDDGIYPCAVDRVKVNPVRFPSAFSMPRYRLPFRSGGGEVDSTGNCRVSTGLKLHVEYRCFKGYLGQGTVQPIAFLPLPNISSNPDKHIGCESRATFASIEIVALAKHRKHSTHDFGHPLI